MAVSYIPAVTNYVINPSGEVNTVGWSWSGGMVTTDATERWAGNQAFRHTASGTPTQLWASTSENFASAGRITVVPGEVWSFGARLKTAVPNVWCQMYIEFFNNSDVYQNNLNLSRTNLSTAGDWTQVKAEGFVIPAGATYMRPYLDIQKASGFGTFTNGQIVWFDAVQATKTTTLPVYVDGSLGAYHRWLGTAHASVSVRDAIPIKQTRARRGVTKISSELWLSNTSGALLENITPYALEGKTVWNVHNTIKSALTLTTIEPDPIVPYSTVVAPIIKITDVEGNEVRHQQGLYITTPAKNTHRQTHSQGQLEGRGLEWILANDYFGDSYSLAAGVNLVQSAINILIAKGLRYSIPPSSAVLPVAKTWPPDVSKLEIVNDLLNGAGYYTVYGDRYGVMTSIPYFELASADPALQIFSGEGSIVLDAIEQEGVYETIANKVIVYKENLQGTPIRVTRTNNDPASPVSTVNLGRVITRVIKDTNIADLNVAKAMALRAIEEGSSFTNKVKLITLPVPDRTLHEVYDLAVYNKAGLPIAFGLWWCDSYELGFTLKSAKMTHHLKRLESYGWDEVVG